jgi:hypothetical protein
MRAATLLPKEPSEPEMFTIEFAEGVCLGYGQATAKVATLRQAVAFVEEFAPGRCGVIASDWAEQDGQRAVEVFDWCACWFSGPIPVLARIIAPTDVPVGG